MMRAYCWRVGGVFEIIDGKCLDCGSIDHKIYEADNCGRFVSTPEKKGEGTHCVLPIDHPGKCHYNLEKIAEEIHES